MVLLSAVKYNQIYFSIKVIGKLVCQYGICLNLYGDYITLKIDTNAMPMNEFSNNFFVEDCR